MFPPFKPSSQISSFVFSFKHRAKKKRAYLSKFTAITKESYHITHFSSLSLHKAIISICRWLLSGCFFYCLLHSIKNMRICQLYNIMSVCQLYNIN